jgi:hypothetical protein
VLDQFAGEPEFDQLVALADIPTRHRNHQTSRHARHRHGRAHGAASYRLGSRPTRPGDTVTRCLRTVPAAHQ